MAQREENPKRKPEGDSILVKIDGESVLQSEKLD